jgi:hypothetical protein
MENEEKELIEAFGRTIIDRDYEKTHSLLAPWLRQKLGPKDLAAFFARALISGAPPPARFGEVGTNEAITLDELRSAEGPLQSLTSYAQGAPLDDAAGQFGPPAFELDDALTGETFQAWGGLDLAPDREAETDLDYCLRLYLAIARVEGTLCIGHVEPELT